MAGNDVFLYSVPSDADRDDVRLRNPNAAATPAASGSAPLSAVGAITAAGAKAASGAAPLSAVGSVTTTGFKGAASIAPLTGVGVITASGIAEEAAGPAVAQVQSGAHGRKREFQRFLDRIVEPVELEEAPEPAPKVSKKKHRIVKAKPDAPKYTPPTRTWSAPPGLKVARPKPVTVYTPDFSAEWDEEDDILMLLAA